MFRIYLPLVVLLCTCAPAPETPSPTAEAAYFDQTGREDVVSGGVRMIPVNTPSGEFRVWTKRVGNSPRKKVLLLHGGPGNTHEYFEAADSYFPGAGIEYYYYDQLESGRSDHPGESTLWTIDRFVSEVEQVRQALGMDADNFYLLGHSWGGILALEYAFAHPDALKGLIVSNMMSSIPDYNRYAQEVLGPQLDPGVLKEIQDLEAAEDYGNPRYTELLMKNYYTEHVLRMPVDEWPEPALRGMEHVNYDVYLAMQGPSEFGIHPSASLADWDRSGDLDDIEVPTLVIGAEHDTMDPEHMEWMAEQFPNGHYLYLPDGSHMAMYDDQERYFAGVVNFINTVDETEGVE
ncbi:proline iminopeptidase [Neolewinella xylanilytica]|uniref:Proline iminopeptidase n=1 Tax=Neolewinella xylanilytica TaxID=1514080 RepID=A0A2S6I1L9_9BACT|nr:proline iminopeptidase-family hydrolase [Neolewinella xylanilytica]PPK85077.1 proline iminopeptidase [Neolewinella xylanilytica]